MRRLVVLLALVPLAACSDDGGEAATPTVDAAEQIWVAPVMVHEDADAGPQGCFVVLESNPPECGGPLPLAGFTWDDIDDEETAQDTTFADANLVGTWDGTTFTVERTDGPDVPRPGYEQPPSACGEPEGGRALVGNGVDLRGEVRGLVDVSWGSEGGTVQNYVVVPGATDEVTAAVRAAGYEGPLCVVERDGPTYEELRRLQREIRRLGDDTPLGRSAGGSLDAVGQRVEVTVLALTDEARAYAEEQWGDLVVLDSLLVPLAELED